MGGCPTEMGKLNKNINDYMDNTNVHFIISLNMYNVIIQKIYKQLRI